MTIENPYKTIRLEYPVTAMGQTFTTIGLRRPKVKDLRHLSGPSSIQDPIGAQNAFLAALSEVPSEVFEEMDVSDADAFAAYVDSFTKVEKKPAGSSTPGA